MIYIKDCIFIPEWSITHFRYNRHDGIAINEQDSEL